MNIADSYKKLIDFPTVRYIFLTLHTLQKLFENRTRDSLKLTKMNPQNRMRQKIDITTVIQAFKTLNEWTNLHTYFTK